MFGLSINLSNYCLLTWMTAFLFISGWGPIAWIFFFFSAVILSLVSLVFIFADLLLWFGYYFYTVFFSQDWISASSPSYLSLNSFRFITAWEIMFNSRYIVPRRYPWSHSWTANSSIRLVSESTQLCWLSNYYSS